MQTRNNSAQQTVWRQHGCLEVVDCLNSTGRRQTTIVVRHNTMTRISLTLLLIFLSIQSMTQNLGQYADNLFFGLLSGKPDSTIKEFIKKYAPIYYEPHDSATKWTVYPPNFEEPKFYIAANSFVFVNHPCFNGPFKIGRLELTQKIYFEKDWFDGIQSMKLWLEFDNHEDAKKSYKILLDTLRKFAVLEKVTSQNGIDKAEFTDPHSETPNGQLLILMTKDNLNGKRLAKPTKSGLKMIMTPGYKILIEIGNDLI